MAAPITPTYEFLSTLSLRRATYDSSALLKCQVKFLSTLSLRRATRTGLTCGGGRIISIHALLAESDKSIFKNNILCSLFLSTLSLRRATISFELVCGYYANFYPRSPCGERRQRAIDGHGDRVISIHALLAESDHNKYLFLL